jgi:hypothetical protein
VAFIKYTQGEVSIVRQNICCSCESDEHQLNFRFFPEDKDPFLYCTIHLVHEKNILKRFLKGIKYILGYRSKYGSFDEIIMDRYKVKELKNIIQNFENFYK